MRFGELDPAIAAVADQKRQELELKFMSVKLKRCRRGVPINSEWEGVWRDYIQRSVARAVADYVASRST